MKKYGILFALIAVLIAACSSGSPSSAPTQAGLTQVFEAAATATAILPTAAPSASPPPPSATPTPTASATHMVLYFPTVTFSTNVACYMGPNKNYYMVANFSIGQSTQAQGHSDDARWLNVLTMPGNIAHTCWVPLSSVKHFASARALQLIKAAPLPTGATLVVARDKYICGVDQNNGVELGWIPAAADTSYTIYRNGEKVAVVSGGGYTDHKTPVSNIPYLLTYVIQASNSVGISNFTAVTSVTICNIK